MPKEYKRVLIKLSGEALAGEASFGLDVGILEDIAKQIIKISKSGVEVALVVGGGNFWRGRYAKNLEAAYADYMGMLATVINAIAVSQTIQRLNYPSDVFSAFEIKPICPGFDLKPVMESLEAKNIVVFAGGTGNPFFTTDTAAALRAVEIKADVLLLAKSIDAVYSDDPLKNKEAIRYSELKYDDLIKQDLKVMDQTAVSLCREHQIPIQVFGLSNPENLALSIQGKNTGTIIK